MSISRIMLQAAAGNGGSYWVVTIGDTANESAAGLKVDSAGGIYIAGNTTSQGTGSPDAIIWKLTPDGEFEWQKTIGKAGNYTSVQPRTLVVDSSDNVILVYGAQGDRGQAGVILFYKFDSSGTVLASTEYDGAGDQTPTGVSIDSSDRVHFAGGLNANTFGMCQWNVNGVRQFSRHFDTASVELTQDSCTDNTNVTYVGYSNYVHGGYFGYLVQKNSTSAGTNWTARWEEGTNTYLYCCTTDASGNVYAAGTIDSKLGLVKYTSAGSLVLDVKTVTNNIMPYNLYYDNTNDELYVFGSTSSALIILKFNSSLSLQLAKQLTVSGFNLGARGGYLDSDGNIHIAAYTNKEGNTDIAVFKLPPSLDVNGTYGDYTIADLTESMTAVTATTDSGPYGSDTSVSLTLYTPTQTVADSTFTILDSNPI